MVLDVTEKNVYTYQLPHGYFSGALKKDICPTVDGTIAFQHILLVEETDG